MTTMKEKKAILIIFHLLCSTYFLSFFPRLCFILCPDQPRQLTCVNSIAWISLSSGFQQGSPIAGTQDTRQWEEQKVGACKYHTHCFLSVSQKLCPCLHSFVVRAPNNQPLYHDFSSHQVTLTWFTLCSFRQTVSKNSWLSLASGYFSVPCWFPDIAHTSVTNLFTKLTLLILFKMCHLFPVRTLTNIAP